MGAVFFINHFCKTLRNLALDAWPAMTNGVYGTVLNTVTRRNQTRPMQSHVKTCKCDHISKSDQPRMCDQRCYLFSA